jgi:serine/threonine protein kinase
MAENDRLLDLLVRWEEQRRQGRLATAEELCPDDPALREVLGERIRQRQRFGDLWNPEGIVSVGPGEPGPGPVHFKGFEVLGVLGEGGMGVVYRARQSKLDRLVALKVIRAGPHAGPQEVRRFRREAKAIAHLHHPNIVQVYQVGEQDGQAYLALELVGGGSLAERLHGTPLSTRRSAELTLALARAVQHAHEQGILHRDLKPANVLLAEDGTPKITDFGLAKRLDVAASLTPTGAILGTASYMAPEQADGLGKEVGPATDVYGLGAILYECLTGRPPFKGHTVLDTLEQVRQHDPVPPTALRPGLSPALETICLKCLEKDPRHRYGSARAFAHDLRCFLQGEPILTRSRSLPEPLIETISYPGIGSRFGTWSRALLGVALGPVTLEVLLWGLFRDKPSYPVICLVLTLLAALVGTCFVLWPGQGSPRQGPPPYRREVRSVVLGCLAGLLMVPLLVALMRPGEDLSEFFMVFPLWILLLAVSCFFGASQVGIVYLMTLFSFALAVLAAWAPSLGPLLFGLTASLHLLCAGLYLRFRRSEERPGDISPSP